MTTPKENVNEKVWIALGMIQPEWIYMNHHFLHEEEQEVVEQEVEPLPITRPSLDNMRVTIRARNESP